jgi:hypothetical protein
MYTAVETGTEVEAKGSFKLPDGGGAPAGGGKPGKAAPDKGKPAKGATPVDEEAEKKAAEERA